MIHPPLSIQTLYDNEFQNRFQGETAQSMFERLSRLFEESDVNYLLLIQLIHILYVKPIISIVLVLILESR